MENVRVQIKTAVMLAAGMGQRLRPYTEDRPKCLVPVAGKPLLAHTIDALEQAGFDRFVIITGYQHEKVDHFIDEYTGPLKIETIYNDQYHCTNNIYTLWFAGKYIHEAFVLIESDLIYDSKLLEMLRAPDRIALSLFDPTLHNGTRATICDEGCLESLITNEFEPENVKIYKTVNMASFSYPTWQELLIELSNCIDGDGAHSFYEECIKSLVNKKKIKMKAIDFSDLWWDEIDSEDDLNRVNTHLASHYVFADQ